MRAVSSRHNPLVQMFREVARGAGDARLLLDGVHLIRDAHSAGIALDTVAFSDALGDHTEAAGLLTDLERAGVDLVRVTQPVMTALSPMQAPSGIVAIGTRAPADPASLVRDPRALLVIAVDVQDPGNLGALVRAGEAGGATGVLVCGQSADPFSWKALRGSMGSALRLPVGILRTADAALDLAEQHDVQTVAASPRAGVGPRDIDWRAPTALLLGGEGPGLPDALLGRCRRLVTIPMQPPVESLNIAVAGALLVYEARRQRS